ncbi:glycosyltransferase, partial [Enterococcus faecalis]|uniref:glycosyltransferase n=1 Tax=Enterococcus faecalis TaxID=1351 RepID=UPI003CC6D74A
MLSIVVPCYYEEAAIPLFFEEVEKISQQLSHSVDYIFVNDGSKDKTLAVLRQL